MATEPDNRKIEELLQAYAKKRREEAGAVELHPATRNLLQAEPAAPAGPLEPMPAPARPMKGGELPLALNRETEATSSGPRSGLGVTAPMTVGRETRFAESLENPTPSIALRGLLAESKGSLASI